MPFAPRWLALGALVALLLALCAVLLARQLSSPSHASKATATASGFTQYRDPSGMFAGSYPSSWRRLAPASNESGVVLLAQSTNGASLLVRKTPIGAAVTLTNLGAARKLTDSVVFSDKSAKLLNPPQAVTLGGLPGYLYLYTFQDPTGIGGAHAHYFLFDGTTMITLVFQAMPANSIVAMAPLFDRIAKTFHALPG